MVKLLTGMNVAYVALEWVMLPTWDVIWESTLEKNPSNVTNVAKHLLEQQILNSMNCAMDCHNSNVIIAPSGSNLEKVFWSTKKFFILTVWKVCWKLNWMMNNKANKWQPETGIRTDIFFSTALDRMEPSEPSCRVWGPPGEWPTAASILGITTIIHWGCRATFQNSKTYTEIDSWCHKQN